MVLSEKTLKLLKNFAGINQSMLFRTGTEKGSLLSTISIIRDLYAEAEVEEEFPVEFAIYDLIELLNTLKLFSNPVLDFNEADMGYMFIYEMDNPSFRVRYTFAPPKHIVYPEKRPSIGVTEIMFNLSLDMLTSITRASNIMHLDNMVITPVDENHVNISVTDIKDNSSNKFSVDVDADVQVKNDFSLVFNMESFKMFPQDYSIGIENGRLSSWYNENVYYILSLDRKSIYNG